MPGAISEQPFFCIQGTQGELVFLGTVGSPLWLRLDGFEGGGRLYQIHEGKMVEKDINEDFEGPVGWETGYSGELLDFASAVAANRVSVQPSEAVEDLSASAKRLGVAVPRAHVGVDEVGQVWQMGGGV